LTEKEILKGYDITVHTFKGDLLPDEVGFYDPKTRTAFISDKLDKKERMKVLLHELGHLDHTPAEYTNARVRCENEANRNMIHHLLKDALSQIENKADFNYMKFMEYYHLTTVADEIMIKEEYKALI